MSTLAQVGSSAEETAGCWEGTVAVASAIWDATVEGVQTTAVWIANGTQYTIAWLADACQWIGENSVKAGIWLRDYVGIPIRDTAITIFHYICNLAVRTYEVTAPLVQAMAEKIRDGVVSGYRFIEKAIQENPNASVVVLSTFVVAAALAVIIDRFLCR